MAEPVRITREQLRVGAGGQILFEHQVKIDFVYEERKNNQVTNFQLAYKTCLQEIDGLLKHHMRDFMRTIDWSKHSVLPPDSFQPRLFVLHLKDSDPTSTKFIKLYIRTSNMYLIAIENEYGIFQFSDSQISITDCQILKWKENYVSLLGDNHNFNEMGDNRVFLDAKTIIGSIHQISIARVPNHFTSNSIFLIILYFCEALRFFYVANKNSQVLTNGVPQARASKAVYRHRSLPQSAEMPLFMLDVLHNWGTFSDQFHNFKKSTDPYPNRTTNVLLQRLHVTTAGDMGGVLKLIKFKRQRTG